MVQYVSWGGQTNLKQGQLALAQQYADAGMFARAKAAFEAAGGTWNNAVHKQLKQEAADTTRYGGDIAFKWSDYGVRTQEQLNKIIKWAKQGQFGQIEKLINSLGGKQFNDGGNRLHKKLAAEYVGFQPDTDPNKVGVQPGEGTTEFKRVEPDVAPVFKPNTTIQGEDGTNTTLDTTTTAGQDTPWRSQFVAKITPEQEGSWNEGQARTDAQKWRNLHMNATMNKYGLSRNDQNQIKRSSNVDITDTQWSDFLKKRNEIAARFEKMITKPA